MKKVFLLSIAAAGMLAVSCKKGPVKAKSLEGTWNVTSMESTSSTSTGANSSSTSTETFDGTDYTQTTTQTSGGTSVSSSTTRKYTKYEYTFGEAGEFTMTTMYTETDTYDGLGYTTVTTTDVKSTTTGTWNIQGKYNEDFLPNDRIAVDMTSSSSEWTSNAVTTLDGGGASTTTTTSGSDEETYPAGTNAMIMLVTEMDKESMTTTQDLDRTYKNSNTNSQGTTTTTTTTWTGSQTTTLSKVGE